jgi:Bifunctional DNA primase/polymerase, N-terminal/Primase C terminal 2 (PriCT-2)
MTSTLAYARDYCRRGWRVIPVPAEAKGPRLAGWQNLDLKPDDLPKYFGDNDNIGIAFGPQCSDLVDLDLDCLEALELADLYLPKTEAEFGRPSKPRSHRLYISPGAAFEAFTDPLIAELAKERGEKPGKDTLLEIRADPGHQTIVPPSIADGEQRAWHGDRVAPRVLPAAALRRAAAWLTIGCLVMRHVSEYAARRPEPKSDGELFPDLPTLLFEAEPVLGRKAFHWLGRPAPDDPPPQPRTRRSRRWLVTEHEDVDLAEIVEAIPNNFGWDDWNSLGMAIFAASDGAEDGHDIFDDFSRASAKYHQADVEERWSNYRKYPPSRTGIGKLVKLARAHGWRARP